jgi:hypothetical protein
MRALVDSIGIDLVLWNEVVQKRVHWQVLVNI